MNHRYFFLFSLYITAGAIYVSTIGLFVYFPHAYSPFVDEAVRSSWTLYAIPLVFGPTGGGGPSIASFLSVLICTVSALVLFLFTLFHFYLISQNITTLEYSIAEFNAYNQFNRFDQGFRNNWMQFLLAHDCYQLCRNLLWPAIITTGQVAKTNSTRESPLTV